MSLYFDLCYLWNKQVTGGGVFSTCPDSHTVTDRTCGHMVQQQSREVQYQENLLRPRLPAPRSSCDSHPLQHTLAELRSSSVTGWSTSSVWRRRRAFLPGAVRQPALISVNSVCNNKIVCKHWMGSRPDWTTSWTGGWGDGSPSEVRLSKAPNHWSL